LLLLLRLLLWRPIVRRLLLACAALSLVAPVALAQGTGLKLHRSLSPTPGDREGLPLFTAADQIEGLADGSVELRGNAEVRKRGMRVQADTIRYDQDFGEVEATGRATLWLEGDRIGGPRLRMRMDDNTGVINAPDFNLVSRPSRLKSGTEVEMRGDASILRMDGDNRYRLENARFTSCKPGNDDWYLTARDLDLDFDADLGVARGAQVTFKGLSTPRLPWIDFPLSNARKSGLLPPTIGGQGKVGAELLLPYYWNIAPNADATLTPRLMTRRGLQLLTEARYLDPFNNSVVRHEYLPQDTVLGQQRSAYTVLHVFNRPGVGVGVLNLNRVSDDTYFVDLSTRLSLATQTYLPNEGHFTLAPSPWWDVTTRVQRFQTLRDPNNPSVPPYERVPQIVLNGRRFDVGGGFDLLGAGEFVAFEHPTLRSGQRSVLYPSVSYPFIGPGAFLAPKLGWHATRYNLANTPESGDLQPSRTLPIFSVDSGLVFERPLQLRDRNLVQTLEPRAYYLYVPYRNQGALPIFDTAVADFNYAQIFSENYYVGNDRVSDANQVTLALTTRLIRADNGQETLRGLIGQRHHFQPQRVAISESVPLRTRPQSSYLLGLGGQVLPFTTLESTAQLEPARLHPERLNVGVRYQPSRNRLLNVSYRYTNAAYNVNPLPGSAPNTPLRQIDVSGTWPVTTGVSFIGRYNFSIESRVPIESLAGFEYNAGCWIFRAVMQRFITATGDQTRAFFLQIELDGFSRFGSNPLEILRRNVPGYAVGASRNVSNQPLDLYE